ncbi:L,D-transpeptidase [Clostridium sp. YIM B02551]|uniref:L,D-transpeptidase n=1 Tax=Clostridium sp. YIM B02551 TaxID=2910679 RepID=UPI001EECC5CB|nr:L,D-transpeptidase [Clostridium sp. YIM B02551]
MNKKFSIKSLINKNKVFIFFYILILSISTSLVIFSVVNYTYLIQNFKAKFNNGDYTEASKIAISSQTYNPVKLLMFKGDLKNFLSDSLSSTINSYKNADISESEALYLVSKIDYYGLFSKEIEDFKATLPTIKESNKNFQAGLDAIKSEDYKASITNFSKVSEYDSNYKLALEYEKSSLDKFKKATLDKANDLASQKYYTDAINLIKSDLKDYYNDDKEISDTIASYEKQKADYLASKNTSNSSKAASTAPLSLSLSNINTLNLTSLTSYMLYVNITNQKTYVFKGTKNNWKLLKTLSCSTGKDDTDTPKGVYQVQEKGDWFYSDKYKQGAKYWVQFQGNYLFHSIPFEEDKKTVIDPSLGAPLSHGCVRLSLEDAKWLYDNINKGTKVIIN